ITLMPHQQDAMWLVRQSMARWGGALLADPVGTGKTWVALAVAREYADVVVVAPAALRARWADALTIAGRAGTFRSFESLPRAPVDRDPRGALLIVDEAHHARNPATRRFDALARLAWGRPVLLLTATPVHNRARDLHTLCSLFLGQAAVHLPADMLARLVCRRLAVGPAGLPDMDPPRWLPLDDDAEMLALLRDLPPPLPPSDGGPAGALGSIALLRQWASSESALLAALERRLTIGVAMESRLAQGGTLSRSELRRWIVETGTVQLGLPLADDRLAPDLSTSIEHVRAHLDGLRAAREHLRRRGSLDRQRTDLLRAVIDDAAPTRCVCFSHSIDTARAMYRALSPTCRTALLAGPETRIASGAVTRDEVVRQFTPGTREASRAMKIDVLVATDVMSEGVDLHDAGVLVHLDLPWTMARLQQRMGRLRRLGSTHRRLQHVAFEPPGGAGRLLRLLDRLARKAGIASRFVGDDPLALALPRQRATQARSPADDASRLRDVLGPWRAPWLDLPGATRADVTTFAAITGNVDESACLALVDLGDGPQLLLRTAGGVTSDAHRIARFVTGVDLERPEIEPGAGQRRAMQLNVRAIAAWCDRHAEQLELLGASHGDTQRRVLRRLAGLRAGGARHTLRALASRLARTSDVVLRSTGAGVERWLDTWIHAHSETRIDASCLDALHDMLAPRARPSRAPTTVRVLAALLLVPSVRPAPRPDSRRERARPTLSDTAHA
ncbi:MAG: DEAD/DEAH box helicase, partial [Cytophagaceae bacterium]|nr:DEAD/DEAH box helicase [Gemmatimonadaceae bacterium]